LLNYRSLLFYTSSNYVPKIVIYRHLVRDVRTGQSGPFLARYKRVGLTHKYKTGSFIQYGLWASFDFFFFKLEVQKSVLFFINFFHQLFVLRMLILINIMTKFETVIKIDLHTFTCRNVYH